MSACIRIRVDIDDIEMNKMAKIDGGIELRDDFDLGSVADEMLEWVWLAVEEKFRREGHSEDGIDGVLLDKIMEDIEGSYEDD